ncbi:MAG: ABC transporter ATP-binding protein [Bacteroidetes bacterium]|nr:ABC transporter ATP-binding protein [Candidatus Colenecus caballi]
MIELVNISKSFGNLNVLKDISLKVNNGEVISITGPSGAGKTTLLQIMGSLDKPDGGKVMYDGCDITGLKEKQLSAFRNRHIGFVFQFHQLLPEFNAKENIMIPSLIAGNSMSNAAARADELLELLGLAERGSHKPSELSGGEKQRIAVARALVNQPDVILADEPSGSLDSHNRQELHNLILKLRKDLGQTFVIVTHDDSLAKLADRQIRLLDGRIEGQITNV